jgi:hypothetical protein
MTTYYDLDDDLRPTTFRCDWCGQRTLDREGVHSFALDLCAECAEHDNDDDDDA